MLCGLCVSHLYRALFDLVTAGRAESCGLLKKELACCLESLWTWEKTDGGESLSLSDTHSLTFIKITGKFTLHFTNHLKSINTANIGTALQQNEHKVFAFIILFSVLGFKDVPPLYVDILLYVRVSFRVLPCHSHLWIFIKLL